MFESQNVIEVKRDGVILGWLVVDSVRAGLSFGGCRMISNLEVEEVQQLSATMSDKLLIHGLPTGGSKGGVRMGAGGLSEDELLKAYGSELRGVLDRNIVIGKDLGATDDRISKIYEGLGAAQLKPVQDKFSDRSIPKKLSELSGYIQNMTALGVLFSAQALIKKDDFSGMKVCIQGAGAVGKGAARRFSESGAKIVGISDAEGVAFCADGIEIESIEEYVNSGNVSKECPHWDYESDNSRLFDLECDLLVLAAGSDTVDISEAEAVKAEFVVEGSNFGLKKKSREVLARKSIQVIPDVIASSSSAAMVCKQMGCGNSMKRDDLWNEIKHGILNSILNCVEVSKVENVTIREAMERFYLPKLKEKIDFARGADFKF